MAFAADMLRQPFGVNFLFVCEDQNYMARQLSQVIGSSHRLQNHVPHGHTVNGVSKDGPRHRQPTSFAHFVPCKNALVLASLSVAPMRAARRGPEAEKLTQPAAGRQMAGQKTDGKVLFPSREDPRVRPRERVARFESSARQG